MSVRTRAAAVHACVDCLALPERPSEVTSDMHLDVLTTTYRPAIPRKIAGGGPRSQRCATHLRAHRTAQRARSRATHKAATFGLSPELQAALWTYQGGRCPCGARAAAELPPGVCTDHNHDVAREHCDHDPDKGCPDCVLGFLCVACNRDVIGRFSGRRGGRAGVSTILRALADFLDDPPLPRLLAEQAATERTAS